MTIDWTINIGALLGGVVSGAFTVAAAVRLYYGMDRRIEKLEEGLKEHGAALETSLASHAARLEEISDKQHEHEGRLVDIIADIAGLLGYLGKPAPWRRPPPQIGGEPG